MGSETTSPTVEPSEGRTCPGKKTGKVPKRIHKAEREKQKREHLNDLFQDLANALDLSQPNNGKASVLNEATRLLKEIFGQIESLKKENIVLLSESHYVTVEKNELTEENSALEDQIKKLRSELRARKAESKPDLNAPPPPEYQQHSEYHDVDPAVMQQPPTVLIVPIHPDVPSSYPVQAPQVSKPHARYPTPADSWPSQLLLGEQTNPRIELQLSDSNPRIGSAE